MLVNQIAVFLENRPGRLNIFAKTLGQAGINLITMSIADTSDFGVLRAVTNDNVRAVEILKKAGFTVTSADLIGIEVPDRAGSLSEVLDELDRAHIDIEYLYSFKNDAVKGAIILFKVADNDKTLKILKNNSKIRLLTQQLK